MIELNTLAYRCENSFVCAPAMKRCLDLLADKLTERVAVILYMHTFKTSKRVMENAK